MNTRANVSRHRRHSRCRFLTGIAATALACLALTGAGCGNNNKTNGAADANAELRRGFSDTGKAYKDLPPEQQAMMRAMGGAPPSSPAGQAAAAAAAKKPKP